MKIIKKLKKELDEVEVVVSYSEESFYIKRIIASLENLDIDLTGYKNQSYYRLHTNEILYIESIDRKTYLYSESDFYESKMTLYELELLLKESCFIRISKSMIVNLNRVRSLQAEVGRRILMTMDNKEKILVSRHYANHVKEELGI